MFMKYILTLILIALGTLAKGQFFKLLDDVQPRDTIKPNYAIIYGFFLPRPIRQPGKSQEIWLYNLDTKKRISLVVKLPFGRPKADEFVCFIKPGNYAIRNYWGLEPGLTEDSPEPIYKGIDASGNFERKLKKAGIDKKTLTRYTFSVTANSINYLGTWDFRTGLVSFTDNKAELDNDLKSQFKRLDFSVANTILPN